MIASVPWPFHLWWEVFNELQRIHILMWEKSSPLGANCSAPAQIMGIAIFLFPWDAEGRNVLFPGLFSWPRDFFLVITRRCNLQPVFLSLHWIAVQLRKVQLRVPTQFLSFCSSRSLFASLWTLTSCFGTSLGSILRILVFSFLARRFKIDLGILLAPLQQQWALQQKQSKNYNHRNKTELCARLRRMFN